jgi:predicted nucleic acid-binding protein
MNGNELCFIDTNLLLYSFDGETPAKRARAQEWLDFLWHHRTGRLSWQVLHEFYPNAVKKMGLTPGDARNAVRRFREWNPLDTTGGLIERAWEWMDEAQLAYWDALIVAAAERSGARYLISEDFQPDRQFGDITVVDPFRRLPPTWVQQPKGEQ